MALSGSIRLVPLLIVALSLGATACSDDEPVDSARAPEAEPASPEPSRTKKDSRPPRFVPGRVELALDPVAEGLEAPLGVVHAGDGSDRLFVVEQTGRVRIIEGGQVLEEPFLDVSEAIVAGGEQGLLGLAFHPEYRRNGRFFVNYTDVNGDTVIAEFRTSDDPNVADAGSGRTLLQFDQPFANHNGGQIGFGPDGFLYIGSGDGGSGGDPEGNGQDTNALLGKLLRIDVDAGGRYGIPEDNPFRDGGGAPEVWAYGLRNPWRFSFDSETDELWIADVGQDAFEEINRVRADEPGLNYGWNVMEGRECFGSDDCDRSEKVVPVSGYSHDLGCSVTGGNVYRGSDFPTLTGGYLFADFCSGIIWGIDARTQGFTEPVELLSSGIAISSFGVDEQEEMYVTDLDGGRLLRVVTQ
jgi:glucose/arabinose dehydrogenase